MAWHPTGRARVSQSNPQALAICDRCGLTYNHVDLRWQYDWRGTQLQNLRVLVCQTCYDTPQEQLRSIIIPPDPVPIPYPRPEYYNSEVPSYWAVEVDGEQFGAVVATEAGAALINEIEDTPTPNPSQPVLYPRQSQYVAIDGHSAQGQIGSVDVEILIINYLQWGLGDNLFWGEGEGLYWGIIVPDVDVELTGASGTASGGSVTVALGIDVQITGHGATASVGNVTVNIVNPMLMDWGTGDSMVWGSGNFLSWGT